jgi:HD-GYP domain-containing protein (c-di-GMP phosphodiesterase class II)
VVVEEHPLVGEAMLVEAGLHDEARWVRSHHERFDGTGYPDGIAGHAIPLEARIIFVADSFETMTSDRPYRAGMAVEEAVAELRLCSGTQFDPAVVTAMIDLVLSGGLRVRALRAAML